MICDEGDIDCVHCSGSGNYSYGVCECQMVHWRSLSNSMYFDSGIIVVVMESGPMIKSLPKEFNEDSDRRQYLGSTDPRRKKLRKTHFKRQERVDPHQTQHI